MQSRHTHAKGRLAARFVLQFPQASREVARKRSFHGKESAFQVPKANPCAVQEKSVRHRCKTSTIDDVTHNRASYAREVHANLVGPTSERPHPKENHFGTFRGTGKP